MSEEPRPRFSPSAEVQARLELQWKRTARRLSDTLTNRLRAELELRFRSQQFRSFDQFVRELEVPTGSLRFQSEPRNLAFLLEPGPRLLFPMLDRLLGGRHTMAVQRRPLTELDRRVALQLSEAIADAVAATWTEPQLDRVRPLGVECDPLRIRIFPPDEPVIVVSFDAQFESIQATMRLCLPMIAILPPQSSSHVPETAVNSPIHSENAQKKTPESQTIPQEFDTSNTMSQKSSSLPPATNPLDSRGTSTTSEQKMEKTTSIPASTMVELSLSLPSVSYHEPLTIGTILPIPVTDRVSLFHVTLNSVPIFAATPLAPTRDSEYRIRVERIES